MSAMSNRAASKTVMALLLSCATLLLARPAAALNADYWRGGWRTPLGNGPHVYEFVMQHPVHFSLPARRSSN